MSRCHSRLWPEVPIGEVENQSQEQLRQKGSPGCHLSHALTKMGDMPDLMIDLLNDFQRNYQDILPTLEYLVSEVHSQNGSFDEETLRTLHTLKGLMGTFAFEEAEQAAEALEASAKAGDTEQALHNLMELTLLLGPIQQYLSEHLSEQETDR